MRKILLSAATLLLSFIFMQAQVVQTTPFFASRTGPVTITFDAAQGNKALMGATKVFAHTGIITTKSTDATDWKNVQGVWATDDNHVLMTNQGNNIFTITYPSINSFYGAFPNIDTVLYLAFVFRNQDGSLVGRNADQSDILVKVYDDKPRVGFIKPATSSVSVPLDSTLDILVGANFSGPLSLSVNGNQLNTANGTSLTYNNYQFQSFGPHIFTATGIDDTTTLASTLTVYVNAPVPVRPLPAGVIEGINYINDSTVVLALLAPFKNFVYVIGDFNDWKVDTNYYMNRAADNQTWWLTIEHLVPGKEYIFQYLVDGAIRIGDPYCEKVSDPDVDINIPSKVYPNLISYPYGKTTGIASVLQTAQQPYVWKVPNFQKPDKKNLVIYEMLPRDFVTSGSWPQIMDSLHYLINMGVNAIELMPIINYEGNSSWGYNPNYFCAPSKVYGTREMLKRFIDTCHANGIAVLLDIALNHAFGTNPMVLMYWDSVNQRPAANSPWFNMEPTHPFNVGYDFNHESNYTHNFVTRVNRHWLKEYNIDGYRFDLTKGLTQKNTGNDVGAWGQYDASRIAILKGMVDSVWLKYPSTICIFEHLSDNPEQTELSNHGILLWGNMNIECNQATMGYSSNSDFSWANYKARGWNNPNLVSYMESHDEERMMFRNLKYGNVTNDYNTKILDTACQRMEAAGTVFFTIPGPKMIWQFGEVGYEISIDNGCRICNKPILWSYMTKPARRHLYNVWSALFHLKTTYPTFQTTNFNTDFGGLVKSIHLNDGGFVAIAIANFDVAPQTASPGFNHTGWWYDYFSGDSMNVTNTNQSMSFKAGEYHLYTDKYLQTPVFTTGIDDVIAGEEKSEISLYPNPNTGNFNLVFDMNQGGNSLLEVYDISGKLVYTQQEKLSAGINYMPVNIGKSATQRLTPGIYFYKLAAGQKLFNGKISIVNE